MRGEAGFACLLMLALFDPAPLLAADPPAPPAKSASPAIRFRMPADGQYVAGPARIVVEATAEAPIDHVSLHRGGALLGIDFEAPFDLVWDTRKEAEGPHTLVARVVDKEFREAASRLTVTVDNTPPTASLTEPRDKAVVVGVVRLKAVAADQLGLKAVRFLANGAVLGDVERPPYELAWNTQVVPNSLYVLQARAIDLAETSTNSPPVNVRVANFNRYPELAPVGPKTIEESRELIFTVEARDPDGRRDPLTYRVANLPAWARFDPDTRQVRGLPPSSETTLKEQQKVYGDIRVEVCDPEPLCDSETISITVLDSDRLPIVRSPGDQSVNEGETLSFLVDATDPDGDALTCKARRLPPWARFDAKTGTVNGVADFLSASLEEPVKTYADVLLQCCDDKPVCSSVTIAITVHNVNFPPVWSSTEEGEGAEGERLVMDVRASDPDEDVLTLTAPALPEGATFGDRLDGTGRITWTPRPDQSGRHTATVAASDTHATESTEVSFRIRERIPSISGTVTDEDLNPIPDVLIRLTQASVNVKTIETDAEGYYLFSGLRPGEYVVRPSYETVRGFSTAARVFRNPVFNPDTRRVDLKREDERGIDFIVTFKE
jgi:hypothetical protein